MEFRAFLRWFSGGEISVIILALWEWLRILRRICQRFWSSKLYALVSSDFVRILWLFFHFFGFTLLSFTPCEFVKKNTSSK